MDFSTWSPFQSQETRRICEHLEPQERAQARRYGMVGGLLLVGTYAVFVGLYLAHRHSALSFPMCLVVLAVDLIVAGVGIWHIRKRMKAFLASTAWASAQRGSGL